jgi:DNA excision repair protein ERCC-3
MMSEVVVADSVAQNGARAPSLANVGRAIKAARAALDLYADATRGQLQSLEKKLAGLGAADFDEVALNAFLREPYCVLAAGESKWRVVVPRWVDFHIGWLEKTTPSYNVFLVDRYARWLGEVPDAYNDVFKFERPLEAAIDLEQGVLVVGDGDIGTVWDRYRDHFKTRRGNQFYVKDGREFNLLTNLVRDGTLPFRPRAVAPSDLQVPAWRVPIELRDYQEAAWQRFLETGAVGVFWPTGAGKTYPGLYALAALKGLKIVVVPSLTLAEQWEERIRVHLAPEAARRVEVVTYQAADKLKRRWRDGSMRNQAPPTLVVFDECHRLPANTFSALSTLPMKYRMGLSATPYREDGRSDMVFALTGFPIGMDWRSFIDRGVVLEPRVTVYVDANQTAKDARLAQLMHEKMRTIVFCDGLEKGHAVANRYKIPFIHGATRNRLQTLKEHETVVMSRVGDEGVSLPDLDRVIEYDFHDGSRRQELQRAGRLMHAEERGEHFVLMTKQEYEDHGKRLLALEDKGFKVRFVRGAGVVV